jgi:metal-dependent amidase/aminoacylase/carboxypeptidase family protein
VLKGTVRSLKPEIRDLLEGRITALCEGIAASFGAKAEVDYDRGYPVTANHARETEFAIKIASDISGAAAVNGNIAPVMGGEDFSFMLQARPGAFIFMGNGDTAGLHHPKYDFNDAAIPHGVSYWAKLVETALPV